MTFKFACPHCGQRISATAEDAGTTGGCPSCEQQFVVPEPPEEAPTTIVVPKTTKAAAVPTSRSEAVPAAATPPAEAVTRRGVAGIALLLSIFPVLNVIALGLGIYAVVRSDRPGRGGERGLAVAALTIACVLFLPMNVGVPIAVVPFVLKGATATRNPFLEKSATPRAASPAPSKPANH